MTATSSTDLVTALLLAVIVLGAVFFLVRPELWRRLWSVHVDPRPVALTRIAFGLVVIWTFIGLARHARVLLTDEGMWLPDTARTLFSGAFKTTILHYWSPPWLVLVLYMLMLCSLALMTLGLWTRWTTLASWVLVLQIYRYEPIYYSSADFVIQNFLFLGMLSHWGEAYSLDSRRRRSADGPPTRAGHPEIPVWPMRLMMLQLTLIYCASGLLKNGEAWSHGDALYYALNLDHFYRVPAQGLVARLQYAGVLPVLTHVVRWWEVLFPVALIGVVLRGYEADRVAGRWPVTSTWRRRISWLLGAGIWLLVAVTVGVLVEYYGTPGGIALGSSRREEQVVAAGLVALVPLLGIPAYRLVRGRWPAVFRLFLHWIVGKRTWLVFGVLLHLGINLFINVGTFGEAMLAVYFVWLSGPEIDAARRFLRTRRQPAGETPTVGLSP